MTTKYPEIETHAPVLAGIYTEDEYRAKVDMLLSLGIAERVSLLKSWLKHCKSAEPRLQHMLSRIHEEVGIPTMTAWNKMKAESVNAEAGLPPLNTSRQIKTPSYNVCAKFYSGESKSFTQYYMADIQMSHAFQALSAQEQLLLFDMIRECNYHAYRLKEKIEKEGFVYIHGQCRVNIPYNGFHKRVQRLVALGWFRCVKVRKSTGGEINRYFPSDNWKQCTGPN